MEGTGTTEGQLSMKDQIRQILADHARLRTDPSALTDDADLYQAGMTSHASVNVMLALEDAFDVEFPDAMLKRSVFQSVSSIAHALSSIGVEARAA
jgi:acyl carrier protein